MKISNINKEKIKGLINKNKRIDKRNIYDYRNIQIETGVSNNAEGSSRVKIGKTEVIVGVKMGTQEPYPDHGDEGTMRTSMEFNPAAGERHENGPPQIDAIEVARVVDRGIRESGFIDFKKLCIKEGEDVWSVAIDIYCINDDGNVLDASALGALVALKVAKMPKYEKGEVQGGNLTEEKLPLTKIVPFTMTFYKIGDKLFLDPNREEEDASNGRLTLSISSPDKEKIINSMQKGGVSLFFEKDIEEIIKKSEEIYDKIFPGIEKRIKELEK